MKQTLLFSKVLVFFAVIGLPGTAQAGLFSILASVFDNEEASASEIQAPNSQNMALLKAAVTSEPHKAVGGGDITVIAGSALLAELGPLGTMADIIEEKPKNDQISIYIVREGDTLSKIAEMFDVTTNTILWANEIRSASSIGVGQELIILPITGVRHTVAKGDTLGSIIKEYKADLDEVLSFNGLSENSTLSVGDELVIPHGEVLHTHTHNSSSGSTLSVSSLANVGGYFIRPVSGIKTQGIHGHNAVDIAAPVGTPIVASASGTVIISRNSGWNGGYGNYIVIKHNNGTQTLYSHNSSNIVSTGEYVRQGQVIGYVGSTGRSTGAHLHFEVRGAKNPF